MEGFGLQPAPFVFGATVGLLYTIVIDLYLLSIKEKSRATWHLFGFFICATATLMVMFVKGIFFLGERLLTPLEDTFLLIGGIFLMRFAYLFPEDDQPKVGHRVAGFVGFLAGLALGYSLFHIYRSVVAWRLAMPFVNAFFFLMPIGLVFMIGAFIQRSLHFAHKLRPWNIARHRGDVSSQQAFRKPLLHKLRRDVQSLLRPPNGPALAHRDFALTLLSGMIQALGSISSTLGWEPFRGFGDYTIVLGTLVTLMFCMWVYLSHAPQDTKFNIKLVGMALGLALAIFGAVGMNNLMISLDDLEASEMLQVDLARQWLEVGAATDFPADAVVYVAILPWDPSTADDLDRYQLLYTRPERADYLTPAHLHATHQAFTLDEKLTTLPELQLPIHGVEVYEDYRFGKVPQYRSYFEIRNDQLYEYAFEFAPASMQSRILRLIVQMVVISLVVIGCLPLFFRAAILRPLQNLLDGVEEANRGNMDVFVPVTYGDEIGYLTRSFNGMIGSIRAANDELARINAELEDRVAARTAELSEANRLLQEQNAELDAFAHTVAHDLKNPLGVLIGFSSMIEERYHQMTPEMLSGNLHVITRTGFKLSKIVEELLLLASVREAKDVRTEPLEMGAIVHEVKLRLYEMVDEYGAELVEPDAWPLAVGYAPWVEEVWVNYVSNALKYGGSPPRIELGVTPQEDGYLRFWVRDNGDGLSREQQARLFTEFTRLHQARADGHGLGLSIVQRIVDKLGGEVGVVSEEGAGSLFYFTLPECDFTADMASY
jgi:signal transduction histidine kinase/tetrahydromethanopterin S-methyltransferase subunit G